MKNDLQYSLLLKCLQIFVWLHNCAPGVCVEWCVLIWWSWCMRWWCCCCEEWKHARKLIYFHKKLINYIHTWRWGQWRVILWLWRRREIKEMNKWITKTMMLAPVDEHFIHHTLPYFACDVCLLSEGMCWIILNLCFLFSDAKFQNQSSTCVIWLRSSTL